MSADSFTVHGGRIDLMRRAFPQAPRGWVDLSTGINPHAYPHGPFRHGDARVLPEQTLRASCEAAMAARFGCAAEACRAVPGTELVIRLLPYILRGRRVAVRRPSYADHEEAWRSAGARLSLHDDPLEMATADDVSVVVIVNPNNPDGRIWTRAEVAAAHAALMQRGGTLIVDEAYADLSPEISAASLAGAPGLIILRSFGKTYGLPGLRLGCILAEAKVLRRLDALLGHWAVSGTALRTGQQAYGDTEWLRRTAAQVRRESGELQLLLNRAGLVDRGGTLLFRYVRTDDAMGMWTRLAKKGIAVRRFDEDPHHLRIGLPGSADALERLQAALTPSG